MQTRGRTNGSIPASEPWQTQQEPGERNETATTIRLAEARFQEFHDGVVLVMHRYGPRVKRHDVLYAAMQYAGVKYTAGNHYLSMLCSLLGPYELRDGYVQERGR